MIELGRLREGVLGGDFRAFYQSPFKLKNIRVPGIGAQFTRFGGGGPKPQEKPLRLKL